MKGDIPTAAFRLLATLPVRTHCQSVIEPVYAERGGKQSLAIKFRGVDYESLTHAQKELRMARDTIKRKIEEGEGAYV